MSKYHNITDESLVEDIIAEEAKKAEIESKIKLAKNELLDRRDAELKEALRQKKEPFGAVSAEIGTQKVTFTTPKKVEWNQEGLAAIHKEMTQDGADPSEYMTVEYKIKEDAYKNWPSNLKEYFEPHRTVTPGNISIKIEPIKEK